MGKEVLTELEFEIFKNWLDTRLKMETHEPNVYPTILGGVSKWALLAKVPVFKRQKMELRAPKSKSLAKHN